VSSFSPLSCDFLLFLSSGFFLDFAADLSSSSDPMSLNPSSPPLGRFSPDCSKRTSWFALIEICLCSSGVKTLAPPLGNDFSSSLKTLGLGAALSGFDLAGDGCSASDFRRFADRSVDAPFAFFDGAAPCSAFRLIAPMMRKFSGCGEGGGTQVCAKSSRVAYALRLFWWVHARRFSDPRRQGSRGWHVS